MKHHFSIGISLVILLTSCFDIMAQTEISGLVKDNEGVPIESANVLAYDDSNNIIGYSYTKANGSYAIKLKAPIEDHMVLYAISLGYQKKTDTLKIVDNKTKYIVNFNLREKIEQLSEVVLKPDEKISRDGNVTTYKVKAFNDGTEQTVEDVLKNLPGVEILKNGTIKAHGRLIDKLLIEGEDMFDKNYTILSKNLDAKVLNEVEILDGFEDNPVLAKVMASEKVAINLVLKDEYKNIWFGNASIGIGTEERFKAASNIGLIRKKIKFFNFNNYNNLGTKAAEQLDVNTTYDSSSFSEKTIEPRSSTIYGIPDNNNSIFEDGESTFNEALINSLSFVTNLKPTLKVRGTGYVTNDVESQLSESKTVFNTGETPITYTEKNNAEFKNTVAGGELELKYFMGEASYLKNKLVYDNNPRRTDNRLLFNDNVTSEVLKEKEHSIYNHLNYSQLIGKKNALHNYLYFGKDDIEQNAIINSPVLNDLFSQPENGLIDHSSKDELSVYGIKSSTLLNLGKLNNTLEFGYESIREQKENSFVLLNSGNGIEVDSLQNKLDFKQRKAYLKTNFKYPLSKKVEISTGLSLEYVNLSSEFSKNDRLFLNPTIRLHLKGLKIGYVSFGYRRSYKAPRSNLFLTNYQLSSHQSFRRGIENIEFPTNDNFSFHYGIKNSLHTQTFNIRMRYATSNGRFSSSNQIGQNIVLSTAQFVDSGNSLSSNIDFTSYFKKLNLSTNLGTIQNFTNTPIRANTSGLKELKIHNASYFLSGRTYFKLPLNFTFKLDFRQTKSKFNGIESTTIWKSIDFNATYKLSKTFIASLDNKFYLLKDGNYSFMNLKIDYSPEKSRFSYQFTLNNLIDEKLFSIDNIDEFSTYRSTTRLLPRYIFGLVKYRF